MIYFCQPFDLDDRNLIDSAYITGQPRHIAAALEAAIHGFRVRIQSIPAKAVIINDAGEFVFFCIAPRNYFDTLVIRTIMQEISDSTGYGVALVKTPGPEKMKQPASPEVEFLPLG
jgi:hypothetical protein